MKVVLPTISFFDKASEVLLLEKYALTISTERLAIESSSTVQVKLTVVPLGQIGLGLSLTNVIEIGAGTIEVILHH